MGNGRWIYVAAAAYAGVSFLTLSIINDWWLYPQDSKNRGSWIYEYQSLLGAVVALVGALITVAYLRMQIAEARQAAADDRRIAHAAHNRPILARLEALRVSSYDFPSADRESDDDTFPTLSLLGEDPELRDMKALTEAAILLDFNHDRLAKLRDSRDQRTSEVIDRAVDGVLTAGENFREATLELSRLLAGGWPIMRLQPLRLPALKILPTIPDS